MNPKSKINGLFSDKHGFTKAEIIVTLAIVFVLIVVNVVVANILSKRTDDLQVISDISQIRSAIELNYAINTFYPKQENIVPLNDRDIGTEKLCLRNFSSYVENCDKVILSTVPNSRLSEGNQYLYQSPTDDDYLIQFNLHYNYKKYNLIKGSNCATREGLQAGPCFSQEQLGVSD